MKRKFKIKKFILARRKAFIKGLIKIIVNFKMKRAIKRTFAIICVTIVVLACNFSALTKAKIDSDDGLQIRYKQLTQYVEDFLDLEEGKLSQPYELYDINDEVNALLFTIKDGGYSIIHIDNYDVPEYSFESNTYYKLDGSKLYYDGPLNDYQQVANNELENALTKSVVSKWVLESTEWYGIPSSYIETKAVTRVARVTQTISRILPNYSYNPDGRCGAVAVSMWLRYDNIIMICDIYQVIWKQVMERNS